MEITYLGYSSFKMRGKGATIVTDPFDPQIVGIKFPKLPADMVTISHTHKTHNFTGAILETPLLIAGPGEYEVKGIKIIGIATYHDDANRSKEGVNTVYRIEVDGISLVHCGDLGHKFNEKDLDSLDGVDILLIPVGGVTTINSSSAIQIISQIEPKIVIPMHYNVASLDQKKFSKLAPLSVFLKEMGKEEIKPIPKLVISKDRLPAELTVVVLE